MSGAPGWTVVCDFDGTATTEDIGDQVAIHFAGREHWERSEEEYRRGGTRFADLLARNFAPITATREEIGAFAAARAVWRPGFERFLRACREAERPVVLCSAGLDVYVEPVLARLPAELLGHLELRANAASCSPEGLRIAFHGGGALDCGGCGFCKGKVVRELQAAGRRVALVGDGSALARFCEERAIRHLRFETFDEVLGALPGAP
jgi:2-hydroxy-3-keto-5-methylthiopentenyl-1-phosphate phosphatase